MVSAAMLADRFAIHHYARLPVHCAEVQTHMPALPRLWHPHAPPVPKRVGFLQRVHDARQRGINREGNKDLSLKVCGCVGKARRNCVIPKAIEIQPVTPGQLRAGILGKGVGGIDLGGPTGHERTFSGTPRRLAPRRGDKRQDQNELDSKFPATR